MHDLKHRIQKSNSWPHMHLIYGLIWIFTSPVESGFYRSMQQKRNFLNETRVINREGKKNDILNNGESVWGVTAGISLTDSCWSDWSCWPALLDFDLAGQSNNAFSSLHTYHGLLHFIQTLIILALLIIIISTWDSSRVTFRNILNFGHSSKSFPLRLLQLLSFYCKILKKGERLFENSF